MIDYWKNIDLVTHFDEYKEKKELTIRNVHPNKDYRLPLCLFDSFVRAHPFPRHSNSL